MPADPLEERARQRIGVVLRGKYRLDRVLGVGGMAAVYKATHRNQAEFAIKVLHPELSIIEDIRNRFVREGYAANSVRHAGVVRVVDDDVAEDGAAFLVMELLDGIACDALAQASGGRLPLDVACSIAFELLEVLGAAHAQGIVHRDIKPANLFLLRDGSVKVLDFGIARVRDTMGMAAHVTGTGMLLGTPAFMAPEQAVGKASDVDARADIWAVGATVFGLTSGENVHDAETAPQLFVKLATQHPRSLSVVVPNAPPAIVTAVDYALVIDKTRRWPSAEAMRDALGQAMQGAFAVMTPRARIASAVAAHLGGPTPATPGWQGAAGGLAPAGLSAPPARSSGFGSHVDASTPPVVDTSSPVSRERLGAGGGGARGLIVALVVALALASGLGIAFVVRAKKSGATAAAAASSASATPVPPASSPSPQTETPTADSPHDVADAGAPLALAPGSAAPAASSLAARKDAPPKRDPAGRPPVHYGQAVPVAPASPPTPRPPAAPAPAAPATTAAPDPLDGRR
jgi:serine/threonine-protein kinase